MKKDRTSLLYKNLAERILVLDGAMGTMIQSFKPEEKDFKGEKFAAHPTLLKGNNDVLNITRPDIIKNIHAMYFEAGADIVESNTFSANIVSQREYGLEEYVYDIAFAGASIAAETAAEFSEKTGVPRFAAGSIGPTGKTLSMSPDVNDPAFRDLTFREMVESYKPGIKGLIDGGVDMLLIETIFDTLNAKAAAYAAQELFAELGVQLPIMFSGTVSDSSGRLLAGQNTEAFLISVAHTENLLSVGFNCALGAEEMRKFIEELAVKAPCFVSAHPNAGLPDELGRYHQTPEKMAEIIRSMALDGLLNIVGGCCGTNPDFIRAIALAVKGISPRKRPEIAPKLRLANLDSVVVSDELPFINIGERGNVAGSRKFLNLMKERNYAEGLRICRSQIENGAQVLDINMDDAMLDAEEIMETFLLNLGSDPDIAKVPVMLDSSRWEVIRKGLQCVQGKCIINSISLKEGEEPFLAKAREARKFGAAILAMAFDENGQADTVERRVEVCKRMYALLTEKAGVPPEDIIFDPNVFAVATGMAEHRCYGINFIEAVRQIKEAMPLVSVSGGISNVSFSFRGNEKVRRAMHSVFLYHAVKAGLGMAIVNPAQLDIYDDIEPELRDAVEAVILNTSPDADEKLLELASKIKNDSVSEKSVVTAPQWRIFDCDRRLQYALVHGDDSFLNEDLQEALKNYSSALEIIEGPLMGGMRETGKLFGDGKMFLPQVVKTARTMKKAVEILTPYLNADEAGSKAGTVVLATVKGDVHDIGKNIVGVILRCNNYEVIDLGVMVEAEKIIAAAKEYNADAVGLCGLITPSLAEMVTVASMLEKEGMSMPLIVGGATTSVEHTALFIQPHYHAPCVQVSDASQIVPVLNALLNDAKKADFEAELNAKYEKIRAEYQQKNNSEITVNAEKVKDASPVPIDTDLHIIEAELAEIIPFMNWESFYRIWDIKGESFESKKAKSELKSDAEKLLTQNLLRFKAVFRIAAVKSYGETVEILSENGTVLEKLKFPRRVQKGVATSLADFLAEDDYLGFFALSAGFGAAESADVFMKNNDEYSALLIKILAESLAEAFAEKLHRDILINHWQISAEIKDRKDLFNSEIAGVRAAPGYPSCPDHKMKLPIFKLLDATRNIGIALTENYMMLPAASICAFIFASPESHY